MAYLWYFDKRDTGNFSEYNDSDIGSFYSGDED
jgi:hypothetical protein